MLSRRAFLERSATAALVRAAAAGRCSPRRAGTCCAACGGGDGRRRRRPPARAPGQPGHVADLRRQPADRVRARAGERDARIYNWNGYLWPRIMKDFGKEYGVEVELTTFSTTDEAIAKIASGAVDFDVFFPSRTGSAGSSSGSPPAAEPRLPPEPRRTSGRRVQDPFYDKGSQYTVPYTIYTTGIGYRTDKIATTPDDLSNPYEIYWDERQQGEDVPPRRQPRGAGAHAPEERDHGHQHREAGGHRAREDRSSCRSSTRST